MAVTAMLFTMGCQSGKKPASAAPVSTEKPPSVIEASGKVKAKVTRNILLDFSAPVQEVHSKEGQILNEGDRLVTLDLTDIQKQIQDKESQLQVEKLQLEKLQKGILTGNTDPEIVRIENNYRLAKSNYDTAYNNFHQNSDAEITRLKNSFKTAEEACERAKEDMSKKELLYTSGAVSKNELLENQRIVEDKEKQVADARLSLDNAVKNKEKELDQLKNTMQDTALSLESTKFNRSTDTEIQQLKIRQLETEIQQLREKLNKPYIKGNQIVSDLKKGVVTEIGSKPGDLLQANAKAVSIADLSSLTVEAEVSEDFIKDVKIGAPVQITTLADSSKKYAGKVTSIAGIGVEKNGDTIIKTEIGIENPDEFLKPGFNVDVVISMEK